MALRDWVATATVANPATDGRYRTPSVATVATVAVAGSESASIQQATPAQAAELRELIDGEDHAKPYSDEDLTSLLHDRGLPLARRTVAKYREALGILPSRFRI